MEYYRKSKKHKYLLNITTLFVVMAFSLYVFAFSLPHNFHGLNKAKSFDFSKILKAVHLTSFSNDFSSNHEENEHNSDNCPICSLSYFNGLYFTEPLTSNVFLQETNEKPVNNIKTGFSSFTFLKFFLRSPPPFTA